jgi:hypothetical protein
MTRSDTIHRLTGRTIIYSKTGNDPSHDSLPLPDGRKVGDVDTEELRGIFAKFGIADCWTDGRASLVSKWASFIGDVYAKAGQEAVRQFLSERRRYGE